ncbi:MAG: DUF2946 domain-containing protein [Gallionella sp.]
MHLNLFVLFVYFVDRWVFKVDTVFRVISRSLFDRIHQVCQAVPMSHLSRKFVAILMLLWLPLFSGSALAASVSMQAQRGACHEASMQEMHHADAGEHQHHDTEVPVAQDQTASTDQSDTSCNSCGVCHLACSGYLAVPGLVAPDMPQAVAATTPYTVSFHSVTSTPLVPPPLVRA